MEESAAAPWKNKRDKYRRELKKYKVSHSGDAANNFKLKWLYFETMYLLKDLLSPAVKLENLPTFQQAQDDRIHSDMEEEKYNITDTQFIIDPRVFVLPPLSVSESSISSQERRPSSVSTSSTISQQQKQIAKDYVM